MHFFPQPTHHLVESTCTHAETQLYVLLDGIYCCLLILFSLSAAAVVFSCLIIDRLAGGAGLRSLRISYFSALIKRCLEYGRIRLVGYLVAAAHVKVL